MDNFATDKCSYIPLRGYTVRLQSVLKTGQLSVYRVQILSGSMRGNEEELRIHDQWVLHGTVAAGRPFCRESDRSSYRATHWERSVTVYPKLKQEKGG